MDWQPTASIHALQQRAKIIQSIRAFFYERNYLEVETPVMAHFGVTDVYLSPIRAVSNSQEYCLQTSPEYHMKRLLASGIGSIFQLTKAFRDDELGRWHNPEFTMLEWYKVGADHHQLLAEMDSFLQLVLQCPPLIMKTYQQIFEQVCAIDPFTSTIEDLQKVVESFQLSGVIGADETDRDQYLFLLMSHIVEPFFKSEQAPIAVYNFPISQASLAQTRNNIAERFEIYYQGVELANGFHELRDAKQQSNRFDKDIAQRKHKGLSPVRPDPYLLQALTHGLPACSGVALGVDRLVALALKESSIDKVMAFTSERA